MFYFNSFKADLATERECQLTKGKRTERTERDLRCSICRFAIGQADFFICASHRQCGSVVFAKSEQ